MNHCPDYSQVALNDLQTFEAVSSVSEDIVGIIVSCTVYEKIYWSDGCQSAKAVIDHLPDLYAKCLSFMAKAITYFRKTTTSEFPAFFRSRDI